MFKRNAVKILLAVAVAAFAFAPSMASACDSCSHDHSHYQPDCFKKTITVFVKVKKPAIKYVTRYTDCGEAYEVPVRTFKFVKVPVRKTIWVCDEHCTNHQHAPYVLKKKIQVKKPVFVKKPVVQQNIWDSL